MIIGRRVGSTSENKITKQIVDALGCLDLHTQIRIKPFVRYVISNREKFNNSVVVEVGCGRGYNCFEVFFNANPHKIVGFDLNSNEIDLARKLVRKINAENKIIFYSADVTKVDFDNTPKADFILLIDFLEHLEDPKSFLNSIIKILSKKSEIIVSVPTYNYKKIFGKKFHRNVGHVREGYNLKEIKELFGGFGYKVKEYSYNTGLLGAVGCFFYYRFPVKNKYFNMIKVFILYPFSFFDFFNSEKISSSLFVVLERDENV